jgi:hypothetical protein
MSTPVSAELSTHHRFSQPLAAVAAVVVLVGGAAVVGVALAQDDDTAPSNPTAPAQVNPNPPSRVGQGDFTRGEITQTQKGPGHRTTFRGGGHPMFGAP